MKIEGFTLKKFFVLLIISLIVACGAEFALFKTEVHDCFKVVNCVFYFTTTYFALMHFCLSKKALYEPILKNRFLLGIVGILYLTIIGYFINGYNINTFKLGSDIPYNLFWNIKFVLLFLVSYELFMILTNEKVFQATIGSIVIGMSSFVQYNMDKVGVLIVGMLFIVTIDRLLKLSNKDKVKAICYSLLSAILIIAYMFVYRPYAKSFALLYVALLIWEVIKNKKNLKDNKNILWCFICTIVFGVIAATTVGFIYNVNQEVCEVKQIPTAYAISYLYNVFLPFKDLENKEALAGFVSIFPVPMLISLYYTFKNDDESEFLFPVTFVAVVGTIISFVNLPESISFLNNVNMTSVMPMVWLANILIMFYIFGNIFDELFNVKVSIRITVLSIILMWVFMLGYPQEVYDNGKLLWYVTEFTMGMFLFINYGDKKYKNVLLVLLALFTLISGVPVNFLI